MFARFNQEIRPDLYLQSHNHFTRLSTVEHSLLRMLLATPGLLPGLLWLMLVMEELTTAISSELITHPQSGELYGAYIRLHQRHLHDEKVPSVVCDTCGIVLDIPSAGQPCIGAW